MLEEIESKKIEIIAVLRVNNTITLFQLLNAHLNAQIRNSEHQTCYF